MLNGIFAVEKINSEVEDEPWKIQWKSLFSASRPHTNTLEKKMMPLQTEITKITRLIEKF